MSQADTQIPIDQSGAAYRTADNAGKKAVLNHHKGNSAPSYLEAGMIWINDTATPWLLNAYDGASWITLGAIDATAHTYNPYLGTAALRLLNNATDTGAANAYATAPVPAITAYVTGQTVLLKPAHASTGASTIAVSGLATKSIKGLDGSDPVQGTLLTTGVYPLMYDGTNFVLLCAPPVGIPQNSQSTAYTTVLSDNGKHLLHPSADTTARTFTIDSNANVAYPIGAIITFVNENAAGVMTIAITSDTMRLAPGGTTGSRTLAANGMATALKIVATEWIISGVGLT